MNDAPLIQFPEKQLHRRLWNFCPVPDKLDYAISRGWHFHNWLKKKKWLHFSITTNMQVFFNHSLLKTSLLSPSTRVCLTWALMLPPLHYYLFFKALAHVFAITFGCTLDWKKDESYLACLLLEWTYLHAFND